MVQPGDPPRHVITGRLSSARDARDFVAAALADVPISPEVMNDIRLVVSELVSNAIQHGDGAVEIEVDLSDERWLGVAVTGGDGLPEVLADPSTWTIAPAELPAGRGLGIVRSLVQELSTTNVGGLASVRCRVRR